MDFNDYYKMPFYMAYPMQNMYLTEMEYEKDMERMKELYPKEVRQLQELVEHRCDELEYEGSRIYDENPDFHMMEMEVQKIYENMRDDDWLKSLIHVLFGQEVYCRRCRNKRW